MRVEKAYEITDAKISFVSLVDKGANLRSFLITKAENGQASFSTYGRIVIKDAAKHYVTGIVYEPLVEDAHGNFMTEEEITKACYYYAKARNIDIQHSFEPLPDDAAAVVESWIAKADFEVGEEAVKKGTWLMTVEITDNTIWDAIEKGEITGFSMGGVGKYGKEDVDLEQEVEKTASPEEAEETKEKQGIIRKLAKLLGIEPVEKGAVADLFAERAKSTCFWQAFYSLQDVLYSYDYSMNRTWFEDDEAKIREALEDFSKILLDVLSGGGSVAKQLETDEPIHKAGKKMSTKNKERLQGICNDLAAFLKEFDDPEETPENKPDEGDDATGDAGEKKTEEDSEVKKSEVIKIIQETVPGAVAKALGVEAAKPDDKGQGGEEPVSKSTIQQMIQDAVTQAISERKDDEVTKAEDVQSMVEEAVTKAVSDALKARGVPTSLSGEDGVQKQAEEEHYLHGIL